jgi:hypothetical protein
MRFFWHGDCLKERGTRVRARKYHDFLDTVRKRENAGFLGIANYSSIHVSTLPSYIL